MYIWEIYILIYIYIKIKTLILFFLNGSHKSITLNIIRVTKCVILIKVVIGLKNLRRYKINFSPKVVRFNLKMLKISHFCSIY